MHRCAAGIVERADLALLFVVCRRLLKQFEGIRGGRAGGAGNVAVLFQEWADFEQRGGDRAWADVEQVCEDLLGGGGGTRSRPQNDAERILVVVIRCSATLAKGPVRCLREVGRSTDIALRSSGGNSPSGASGRRGQPHARDSCCPRGHGRPGALRGSAGIAGPVAASPLVCRFFPDGDPRSRLCRRRYGAARVVPQGLVE
jgi:hypothetical protein